MSGGCLAFPGWSEPWLLFAPLPPIIKDLTFKFVLKVKFLVSSLRFI